MKRWAILLPAIALMIVLVAQRIGAGVNSTASSTGGGGGGSGTVTTGTGLTGNGSAGSPVTLVTPVAVGNGGTGVTSAQGNGSKVQLSTGTPTANDCVKFDAAGNVVDSGGACGGSGVSSIATTSPITGGTITTTGTIGFSAGSGFFRGVVMGNTNQSGLGTANTQNVYFSIGGNGLSGFGGIGNNPVALFPFAVTIKNLYCATAVSPGTGHSWALTLQNPTGTDSALTCTISDTNTSCSDSTHSVSVSAGAQIQMHSLTSGTANSGGTAVCTMEYDI